MASISTTPYLRAASIIARASRALEASGFSHSTCLPQLMQRMLCDACRALGEAI